MIKKDTHAFFNHHSTFWRVANQFIALCIIISVSIIPLYFVYEGAEQERLLTIEKIIVTIFVIEYIIRIIASKNAFKYIFSWWGLIDLISILPFFVYKLGIFPNFPQLFLEFRILRLLKFARLPAIDIHDVQTYEHFMILPEERLQKIVQKHPIVFLSSIVLPIFLTSAGVFTLGFFEFTLVGFSIASIFLLLALLFYIKTWLDYKYDVFVITDRRIIIQRRELFGTIANDVRYESITNVIPNNNGILRFIFGFGSIKIETAAVAEDICFKNIPHIKKISFLLTKNRQKAFDLRSKKKPRNKSDEEIEE